MSIPTSTTTILNALCNIYPFGGNTGGISVDPNNTVYFVGSNGNAILNTDTFGTGYVDLFFQEPPTRVSGLSALQIIDSKIYVADTYTGNIYYFDFYSGLNSLQFLASVGIQSKVSSIVISSNNMFYNRLDQGYQGVYMLDINTGTSILIESLINPTKLALDPNQNLYVACTDAAGNPCLTEITFIPLVRSPIAAPVPTPHFPNCGLPAPGNCKKVVIPFNPTTYWGLLSPQRIAIHRPPANIPNCYNTFYQLCPTIPPIRTNPAGGGSSPPPVRPQPSTEVPTTNVTKTLYSPGIINTLRPKDANNVTQISTAGLIGSTSSNIQPVFGGQGNIYFMSRDGFLSVLTGYGYPSVIATSKFPSVSYPPVTSIKGYVSFITDSGTLYVTDASGNTQNTYSLNGRVVGSPAFLDLTYTLVVAACDNRITAYNTTVKGGIEWSSGIIGGDSFVTPVTFDGYSVFVGTNGGNIVSYNPTTGAMNWTYTTGTGIPATIPVSEKYLCFATSNQIRVIGSSPVRYNQNADTIITLSGLGNLSNTPLLHTDKNSTWVYFVAQGKLYGVGISVFLGTTGAYVDSLGGNIASLGGYIWTSFQNTLLPRTPILDGSGSIYLCDATNIYRYPTSTTSGIYDATQTQSQSNYYSISTPPGQVITTTPIVNSTNLLSFLYSTSTSNYIVTISST
jgi:hypothetical protein